MFRTILFSIITFVTLAAFILLATGMYKLVLEMNSGYEQSNASNDLVDVPLEDEVLPSALVFLFQFSLFSCFCYPVTSTFRPSAFLYLVTPPPESKRFLSN